mgnify:CR=1 FL=1
MRLVTIRVASSHHPTISVAVEDRQLVGLAQVLERSSTVEAFRLDDGLGQESFGCGGFKKWVTKLYEK